MKKIIIAILGVFLVTGCSEPQVLDLAKIEEDLNNLTTSEFSIQDVDYQTMNIFGEMREIYDYEFEQLFNLDPTLVDEYNVKYNEETGELLAIFMPSNDNEVNLETSFATFTDTLYNSSKAEHQGYLIYVASQDNDQVIENVRKVKQPIFPNLMKVEKESLELTLDIKEEQVEEVLMKIPAMMIDSSMYLIIKPTAENKEEVQEKIEEYMTNLEENWKTYLPDQYKLVQDRKEEEIGEYLIYIISTDNEKVFETIKD